jgi:hypothetical protein
MRQDLLRSVGPILAAPWQQRRNVGSMWGLLVVVAITALAPVALFVQSLVTLVNDSPIMGQSSEIAAELRHAAANAAAWALGALALVVWAFIVGNLLDQNRPVMARLVPEHPARLRAALLVGWVAAVAFFALVVGVRLDAPLACAAVAGPALAMLAASVRWPLMWLLGCAAPFAVNYGMTPGGTFAAVEHLVAAWAEQRMAICAALVAASAALLVALIQDGGKRHVASDEARRNRIERFQMRARGGQPVAVGLRGLFDEVLTRPYYAWWRFVFGRPATPVFSRVMLGLGPGAHWTAGFTAVFGSALAVAAATLLLEAVGTAFPAVAAFVPEALASLSIGLLFGVVSPTLQMQARLHQTRREQILVSLLPGVPRGAALNRRLAWQLTAQFLASWLGGVVLMLVCMMVANHLRPEALRMSILGIRDVMVIATLPLVVLQWRPWARVAAPTQLNAMGALLLGSLIALAAIVGPRMGWFSQASVGAASFGAALAWCAMRWVRMGREPSAFPMGRLA